MLDFTTQEEVQIKAHLEKMLAAVDKNDSFVISGTISKISGMKIEAVGLNTPLGTVCQIAISSSHSIYAEVIGFSSKTTYLMANQDVSGLRPGAKVTPISLSNKAHVGMALLGRVIDSSCDPIDDLGPINYEGYYPLISKPINPLSRKRIDEPLDVGIKAINALLTVGKGQRLGIFAGSGVGKSVLLGMMTQFTKADVVVVGLIGERGREVKEFIEENLGHHGLEKSVVIASPADTSPLMRVNGASLATALAEYYRDRGLDVLLIVDSLTRFAQAQREISLSVGELPATKGFTPSVFAKISQLVERSGNGKVGQGSITAFYTVLVEGDDHHDPIADHARSVLDGHIFLSRSLADAAHYPAIDIEKSISRVMNSVVDEKHLQLATHFKRLYSSYMKNRDLVQVGMYHAGTDRVLDEALRFKDKFERFLVQGVMESAGMEESMAQLEGVFQL
ncbi:MAG: FliI/YscN family ATPase [Gammaproteobacteria bacterium]